MTWYEAAGIDGLTNQRTGRPPTQPKALIIDVLKLLVEHKPRDLGYQRSRWITELFSLVLKRVLGLIVRRSTIRRLLPKAGIVWRRAAPTLRIKDPAKAEKMAAICEALNNCSAEHPVFYEDEVDIHLNHKIGADWGYKGKQRLVTPGKNIKHYLAGALHSKTGQITYVVSTSKSSELFISLMEKLKRQYRRAKTNTLVVDNYIIHKSKKNREVAAQEPEVCTVIPTGLQPLG